MMAGIVAVSLGGSASGSGGSDPYWANVVSLMHFDGADNSTTFADERGKSWTVLRGSPVIRTTYSLFGGASGYFSGSSVLTSSSSTDWAFGTGDFTVELWVRPALTSSGGYLDAAVGNWANDSGWTVFFDPNGAVKFKAGSAATLSSSAGAVAANTGARIAASRVAGTLYLFVNGTLVASATVTANLSSTAAVLVGSTQQGFTSDYEGWIDELRITKGVGRYTTNYALAPAAFPNN